MKKIAQYVVFIPFLVFSQNTPFNCDSAQMVWQQFHDVQTVTSLDAIKDFADYSSRFSKSKCAQELEMEAQLFILQKAMDIDSFEVAIQQLKYINGEIRTQKYSLQNTLSYQIEEARLKYLIGDYNGSVKELKGILEAQQSVLNAQQNIAIYDLLGKNYCYNYSLESEKSAHIDTANYYFKKSYSIAMNNSDIDMSDIKLNFYTNKLYILFAKQAYNEVLTTSNHALMMYSDLNENSPSINFFRLMKARALDGLGQTENALATAQHIQRNELGLEYKVQLYALYQNSYELLQKEDSANKYLQLNFNTLQNIHKVKNESLKSLYGDNVAHLENENKNNLARNKFKNYGIGLLLLLLLSGGYYFIRREKKQKKQYEEEYDKMYKSLIFNNTKEKLKETNTHSASPITPELIQEYSDKIQKCEKDLIFLNPDFTLNFLAKKIGTNTAYLSYYFNHIKKQSFPNYLNHLRISYALEELKNNPKWLKYSIEGIAKETGFKNASVFSKTFKKIVNIPPSFYIEKLHKENESHSHS